MDTEIDPDMEFFNTLQVEESTEPPPEMPKPKSNTLACIVCDTPLNYSGRGPKPKYCANHKKGSTKSSGPKSRTRKNTGTDYREGILGMLQIPAMGLALAGAKNPVFAADSIVIQSYSPGIAEALNNLAHDKPEVAAALDRVLAVGPYGAIIAAVLPMAMQLLTNHGVIPAGIMGTVPVEQIIPQQRPNPESGDPEDWPSG